VDVLKLAKEIKRLTQSMVEAARESRWADVQDQQRRRQQLLDKFPFQALPESAERALAVESLEEATALNNQLLELGTEARDQMGESMNLLGRGRKANLAYHGIK